MTGKAESPESSASRGILPRSSAQKEVLQTIFDHIPVMVCFVDPAGRIRLVNREWERVLGWSLEEARTLDIAAELYPDPERRREALEFILNPGRGWEEFRTRARDGRTIETAWSNVLLSDGTSIGFGLDIGDRKRAEEAQSSSERQFRAVFEGALDAMIIADDDGRYVDANPAALAMFGLPREQLLARTVDEFAEPGFDAKGAWAAFRRSGSSQGSFRLVRPDGKVLETEFAAKADVLPGRHLSIMRDVTARIRAEGALRDSERRVVAILESITDGFYTLDSDWRFSYVNPQAEPILGKSRGELLGRVVWEEFPEAVGTAFDHEYHRAVAERVPVAFEIEYPPLGGWFSVHAYPWADGLSVYFTDVTERHSAEEALRRSERRFRLVLENSRDVIYQLNLSTRTYDYASPSSLEVLGYAFDELAAGGLARVVSSIHPEDIRRLEGHVARLLAPEPGSEFDAGARVPDAGAGQGMEVDERQRDRGPRRGRPPGGGRRERPGRDRPEAGRGSAPGPLASAEPGRGGGASPHRPRAARRDRPGPHRHQAECAAGAARPVLAGGGPAAGGGHRAGRTDDRTGPRPLPRLPPLDAG